MKVVFFTNNYLPRLSGVALSCSNLKKGLEALGVSVLVIAPRYHSIFKKRREKNIVRIRSFRWRRETFSFPLPFMHVRKIKRVIHRFQPDIVHIHQPFLLGPYGLKIAHEQGLPAVFTYHTINEVYARFIPLSRWFCQRISDHNEQKCAQYCDAIIAPTVGVKDYLRNKGIETSCQVIPTGIDLDLFSKSQVQTNKLTQIRKKNKLRAGQPVLLHVGRLTAEKNIQFLLGSFKLILSKIPQAVLLMIGTGVQRQMFFKQAIKLGIGTSIKWLGLKKREKLVNYYALADLFLFPSQSDTQALVIYEALAMGVPVVALGSLASRVIIQNKVNGRIVEQNSPQAFADQAIALLGFKKKMHWVLTPDYSYQEMALKTLRLYQELFSKGQ